MRENAVLTVEGLRDNLNPRFSENCAYFFQFHSISGDESWK